MSDKRYDDLIERIRQRCQMVAKGAFGRIHRLRYDDSDIIPICDFHTFLALKNDTEHGVQYAFPPASEEQLKDTEALLGFALPPLLRLLYKNIANGGFGPGYGIIGALEGFPLEDGMGKDIANGYLSGVKGNTLIRLEDFEMMSLAQRYHKLKQLTADQVIGWDREPLQLRDQRGNPNWKEVSLYEFPHGVWPERFLPLCYWGCGICSCIDARTEHIFQISASDRGWHYMLEHRAASLAEWLERWLNGESLQ